MTNKVLFEGNKAVGVECMKNGVEVEYFANEIILSGGAINSPQLLMLSGVGMSSLLSIVCTGNCISQVRFFNIR